MMTDMVQGAALVTGGGSGIGRAIASVLAADGAAVAVVDLQPAGGRETVAAIEGGGGKAAFVQADVSQWAEVDRAVGQAVQQVGPLGVVVNAAGILDGYAPIDEMAPEVFERVIAINLGGTFFCCKRTLPELQKAGGGRIVNVASTAGLVGAGGGPAYVASKHGVVGLTRELAVAYADRGVTVNAICPGPIQTGLREHSSQILGEVAPPMEGVGVGGSEAALRAVVPMGRRGTVEEIAAAARFLASQSAAYVTGHTLVVDGGWTAR